MSERRARARTEEPRAARRQKNTVKKQNNTVREQTYTVRGQAYLDYNLLAVVIILICFGLIMLYSASTYDMGYFMKQSVNFLVAIAFAVGASLVDYHLLVRFSPVIYWGAFGLMALVSIIGHSSHGATRWLSIGRFSFQPAEVAKIALILILAYQIVNFGKMITAKRNLCFMIGTVLVQFLGAFLLTDNLSTALIILGIGGGIILVYFPRTMPLILGVVAFGVLVVAGLLFLKYAVDPANITNFRLLRILNWFDRDSNISEGSYQVMQGLYAIGSGGFFGKGLGNSSQKITRIPEAQNDMIFSIICEELGLFGAIILLILFGYLLYRLFYIAQNAQDLHGSIIATGVFVHFSLQIILNMAVVLNLIPTTGVSLPFVSYGGTAILFLMIEIGICLNISSQIRIKDTKKKIDKQ